MFFKLWSFVWLTYLLASGVLLTRPGNATVNFVMGVSIVGFILFFALGEIYRAILKRMGKKRVSFTRNNFYLPIFFLLLAVFFSPYFIFQWEIPLSFLFSYVLLAQIISYASLHLFQQDMSPYTHSRWLDMLFPMVFMAVVAMDWAERGIALPNSVILAPLVFTFLATALLIEANEAFGQGIPGPRR